MTFINLDFTKFRLHTPENGAMPSRHIALDSKTTTQSRNCVTTNLDLIKVLWLRTRIVTSRLFNQNNYSQELLKNTNAVWFTCLRYSGCIF